MSLHRWSYNTPRGKKRSSGVNARWTGLTAGWHLDEPSDGSGAVARVDVLGGFDLTDNNTTPSATGIIGNGVLPASANSESLSVAALTTFTGDVTVCLWVKRTGVAAAPGALVGRYTGADANSSFLIYCDAATTVTFSTVSGITEVAGTTSLTLALNTWHMLTLRKAAGASQGTLDLDDLSATSTQPAGTGQPNTGAASTFNIGSDSTPAQYANNVIIDEVYYFADVLKNDAWVTGMYNGGVGRPYPH